MTIYVKPFSSDTGTLRTDGQTDMIAISILRVKSAHDYNFHFNCVMLITGKTFQTSQMNKTVRQ